MLASLLSFAAVTFTSAFGSTLPAPTVPADEGMWLYQNPPRAVLAERYSFEPTDAWLERVQKSSLRVSTGGSASFVSPNGLVFTNHHVASEILAKLSDAEHDYLTNGFQANSLEEELRCPDVELLALWNVADVTQRVQGSAPAGAADGEAAAARRSAANQIEQESTEQTGMFSEVVTLYQGGAYHLYQYRRYTDVRLVFAPEKQAAFFGGDVDNFEYPRYCLDVTFLRVYENGQPLACEHYLPFSSTGVSDGELVMISGHPGSTERNFTAAHMRNLRDVQYPQTVYRIWRREVQLSVFCSRSEENRRAGEDDLFGVQNSRKAYRGLYQGILDPALIGRKEAEERRLKAWVWSDPDRSKRWGSAWEEIESALQASEELSVRSIALGRSGMNFYSTLAGIAKDLVRSAEERQKPNAERLREYNDAALESLKFQLFSPAPIHTSLEIDRLESALMLMTELLGADHPWASTALAGKSARGRAEELVLGCTLSDIEVRKALYEGGEAAIDASKDPMIRFIRSLDAPARALRKEIEERVDGPMESGYAKIAAARFGAEGQGVYPDATFTLRLSFGKVAGYEEDGRPVLPFTNFAGLYRRAEERQNAWPFNLPASWVQHRDRLDLSTPYNFVHTCDSTGGNSGSPTINRNGEVVGILFDGNIQSLPNDLVYSDKQARSVSVDVRAVIESLRKVYGNEVLVSELVGQ